MTTDGEAGKVSGVDAELTQHLTQHLGGSENYPVLEVWVGSLLQQKLDDVLMTHKRSFV